MPLNTPSEEEIKKLVSAAKCALEHLAFSGRRADIQERLLRALQPFKIQIDPCYLERMDFLNVY